MTEPTEIIERKAGEPIEPPHVEFHVYRSPKDGKTVLGRLSSSGVIHSGGRLATWISMPFGVRVNDAYMQAIEIARRLRISKLYVNDPKALFPPHCRPHFSEPTRTESAS